MEIRLICIAKTEDKYLIEGIEKYEKRIMKYTKYQKIIIPDLKTTKSLSIQQIKEKESELIIKQIKEQDYNIILDEKGTEYNSIDFAYYLENVYTKSLKRINFIIGGPYGFDNRIYKLAQQKISLSKMTFSHQLIRLIFLEQLYRAFTIIKGEPYHHE
ncbi:MAG: 23S rRNA (pseudouridine(1915)-N(3))-methyltransferase RlmH [Bacteroidetes bacterium GWE2_29_8]|nr:MAG: 23S rRNA (pseudouridine(1915)-N(3))-methyltransferase RlmH [Bacteroidetes bacterium GWE2_29_8]OFY23765.1 MAG: 23S rRNA (pseudouridine(1915)-N(3))-methyltransferase RlmH [Bacteroidetes bacterium GWF2_29_10]